MPRPARPLAVLAATALLVSACGGNGDDDNAGSDGTPVAGGTLTFAVSSDQGCVDPQQVGSNDSIYHTRQVVDSLTDQDPETGEIKPWLASSWEVDPSGRTYTFHLRDGVTFSDGSRLDATAVKDTFDTAPKLGPKAALAMSYLTGYTGTEVVDPLTAKVSFAQPNAQFLQASSTFSLGIVSPKTAATAADVRCAKGVVGSGPFVLQSYTPDQSVTLTKRKGYAWGSSLWKKQGEAYLDKVVFQIVPESGVRVGSLQSGQVDAISSVGPQDEATITGSGDQLQARANPGVVFNLAVNHARPLVADPVVRKAISQALNRPEIVSTTLTSQTRPATSILAAGTPLYADESANLGFDQAAAKAALDGAGWVPGADGIRAEGGRKLSLKLIWFANLATNKPVLELVQQQLKAVGIDVQLEESPIAKVVDLQSKGDYDLSFGNITRADPDVLRAQYSAALTNYSRLPASGPLQDALAAQAGDVDQSKRQADVAKIQQLLLENADAIPVYELTTVLGISKDVHDLNFEASSRIQLHDTWKNAS